MRISILCGGSSFYGMERMALAVASGLATRGHSVRVIASGWNDGAFRRRLEERGLPYETIFLGKTSKSL